MKHPNDLIAFSTGEYSDYQTQTYRVLKAFNLKTVMQEFDQCNPAECVSPYDGRRHEVVPWLIKEGYIEDADIIEVHLGSYFLDVRISEEVQEFEFKPGSKKRRKQ